MKKIIITGATGLIGKKITSQLIERGDEVIIFTRDAKKTKTIFPLAKECVEWNYKNSFEWQKYLENYDAVIHLAGANVFSKRWTDVFKKEILESRVQSTRSLIEAIKLCNKKPEVFISASAVGYYGDAGENTLTEDSIAGNDFLAQVCKVWEAESAPIEQVGIRRVIIRTGIVLSLNDGALKQMLPSFKYFIGGALGSGKQWFPWIHIDDIAGIFLHALDNKKLHGAVNAASPKILRMKEFANLLGKIINRPSIFSVPGSILKLALGEVANVVLASQRINVNKLIESGYKFKFENLEDALKDLLKK